MARETHLRRRRRRRGSGLKMRRNMHVQPSPSRARGLDHKSGDSSGLVQWGFYRERHNCSIGGFLKPLSLSLSLTI
ncbi:hypothetical protein GBA52_020934 [Prunus armeniaca]|nr:hypothetical protein GBA52_020934 [Prunus armeniaca]